jgi:predicted nucleotidyltransferase
MSTPRIATGSTRSFSAVGALAFVRVPILGMIVPHMGTWKKKPAPLSARTGLADVLFTPVQQRVLGLLFGQPERRFQSAELIRLAGAGTGAVHRLVTRLAATGLVSVSSVGNQKFYQANPESPLFTELCGLIQKTIGLAAPLQAALAPLADRITAAFVYGSIARGTDRATSDIDLMVIADDLDYSAAYVALADAEAALSRPINPNVMSAVDWRRKRAQKDGFVARIASQPKLFVIGSEHALD